jgi:class 3 adenylate cyclase/predicted ATPase
MWSAAMDVGGWLRGLGLGEYEDNFRNNKIDADVLPQLTADDLRDMGVVAIGDRRRLLSAIAALAGATPSAPAQKGPLISAERRPIAVMFCDLVGSTNLAPQLDAEDWRNIVNTYLDEAAKAVTALGGHVPRTVGDGLMALFGYPQAQENDADRAVRAGLAIQHRLAEINARSAGKGAPELSVRIGIESGPVVVDASGEVFGEAPNVAARVQAAAAPGSVFITMNVQRQVAGLFIAEERGAHQLKGVSEPVQLFRIVRASGAGRRGGARSLTPFVGRAEELGLLARRWERARAGDGQFVLVVGEPGLGKSRLGEEFRVQLAESPHTWVEWSASQLLQNTPLHPIAEWGRQRFGGADVPAEKRLADLERSLREVDLDTDAGVPLLAPLLDIPLPAGREASLAPEELRRQQLAAIVSWVITGARAQPVVLVFEDLQWADPTSIDLFRALTERGHQAPLLLVATARPEFRAPWGMRSHHSVMALAPLNRAQVARMVGEIAARHALSQEVVEGVSERTGGVPLFVEEVTRLLLERGVEGGAQAIPLTLQQSLAARLDRLGPAREAAQIGAVLGRSFTYPLLRDVAEMHEPALQTALERLAHADILFVEGAPTHANYRFKHALIQDAAYDSLLKSRRQMLHRRAAEILHDIPERAATEPEVIAYHFTQAGLDDLAIEWWGKAGDQALRRSAFQEAIAHLGKAIEMADKQGLEAQPQRRLDLQTAYGHALGWAKGFGTDETKAAFDRASEFAGLAEDASARFVAYDAQCLANVIRGELCLAREIAETFLREAEARGRATETSAARRMLGLVLLFQGGLKAARSMLEQALVEHVPERHGETRFRFGRDTEVSAAAYLALAEWYIGEVERARRLIDRALRRAEELGHVATVVQARFWSTMLETCRNDVAAARLAAHELLEITKEHGIKTYADLGQVYANWARGRLVDPEAGASELRRTLAAVLAQGHKIGAPRYHGLLAELEVTTRGPDSALMLIDEGLALAKETGEHVTDPYLHRLRGEILLRRDPANPAPAEVAFQTAIAIANQQGARSFALRAALSLAKLYQSIGRPLEARAVLAPALEGFVPTPEMPEIAEAQALLATPNDDGVAVGLSPRS